MVVCAECGTPWEVDGGPMCDHHKAETAELAVVPLARLTEVERERDAWRTWQGEQHQATYDAKARAEAAETALREAEEALALRARNELERIAALKRKGASS